jgi:hypothetical protein
VTKADNDTKPIARTAASTTIPKKRRLIIGVHAPLERVLMADTARSAFPARE